MALVTTAGASNANSYASVVEADAYIAAATHFASHTEWAALTGSEKEFRLKMAALLLNLLPYRGAKACFEQRLAFPRWWRLDEGYPTSEDEYLTMDDIPSTLTKPTVPQEVKDAQCEVAFQVVHSVILKSEVMAFPEREISAFTLGGSLNMSFFSGPAGASLFSKAKLGTQTIIAALLSKWSGGMKIVGGVV
jgi:hypothetical protein